MYKVSKFGGTSMANYEAMQRSARIVASDSSRKLIVVSATAGTTNELIALADPHLAAGEKQQRLDGIKKRHKTIIEQLQVADEAENRFKEWFQNLTLHLDFETKDKKWRDRLFAFGELMSSMIFTEVLRENDLQPGWLDARNIIKTDSEFENANPDILSIAEQAGKLDKGQLYVTQGFIGSNNIGQTTTLGRGGSDYSAALFAEALDADTLEIWTDVAGVYTTDPRLVPEAKPIDVLTFDEAAELSTFGGKVLHPATLKPAIRKNIDVFVGSSQHPDSGGTRIVHQSDAKPSLRAISLRRNQTLVTVHSLDMLHRHGFLAHLFKVLADHRISVDLVTTSEVSVALTLDTNATASDKVDLTDEVLHELRMFSQVEVERGLTLVALIGNNMQHTAGLSGPIFNELNRFNIRLICHGASPNNLCFLVQEKSAEEVVKTIHKKFIEA